MSQPTPAQLDEIHQDLLKLREQLLHLIEDETGATATVELDQSTQGRLSRMDAIQVQKMAEAQRRRAKQRLERVEGVLSSRDDPDQEFGHCRVCDEPISYPRLKASPDAIFCVECAQEREA